MVDEKKDGAGKALENATHAEKEKHPQIQDFPQNTQRGEDYHKLYLEARKNTDELLTRLKYMQADFENFKKRAAKEKMEFAEYANEALLTDLLPALDELDAAMAKIPEGDASKGIAMLRQNLMRTLKGYGLQEIQAKSGDAFDPDLHEAVGKEEAGEAGLESKISAIAQKGYMLKGNVLRYVKVKVFAVELKGEGHG